MAKNKTPETPVAPEPPKEKRGYEGTTKKSTGYEGTDKKSTGYEGTKEEKSKSFSSKAV